MTQRLSWQVKHYQLRSGKWRPQVHLMELVPGGMDVFQLLAPEDVLFESEDEAKAYSDAMARKWIKDNLT